MYDEKISSDEISRLNGEKRNRNVSGLNPNDFKFFEYKDPYAKNRVVKCSICGKAALEDEFGNGECKNCGWKFSRDEEILESQLGISYPMLVSPTTAREQYEKRTPFKATFKEFVNGLFFYSEMLFTYEGVSYEVFFKNENVIVLCSEAMQREYQTREDFENHADIGGKLLKDIWDDVTFAGFMFCG